MKYPEFSESKMSGDDIPKVAAEAGWHAHNRAMNRLGKVVRSLNGQIVEASADGTVRTLAPLPKPTLVKKGLVLKRRAK
ncbi:hypothetical protein LRS03_04340 [Rhizobacter sp. J219]|jgi:hypothetical protein|uniref:hypothetical protein n=1 Tax=Rhizobacter sp. J219 TaxID=2898430 RepID=UPI00215070CB|nr:hypothetical protein [Rhizobacter sp. J219]MCR5882127.1 hypothetical protein [Rhizobacter sp. J219]